MTDATPRESYWPLEDPSAQRQSDKRKADREAANSFEVVAREWLEKQSNVWVSHHASDVRRRLEANLFGELGGLPIAEITAPQAEYSGPP